MLEAVLPISNHSKVRRNLDRLDLLLKSCNFFWSGSEKFSVHIVVPDGELSEIQSFLLNYKNLEKLNIFIKTESDISPILGKVQPALGVMKQMLIKLAAFQYVESPYCILLDSDVVACKPFSNEHLIRDGRAVTEWWKPSLYQWWLESARILGYDLPLDELKQLRIFVTPQIFCKPLLLAMLQEVSNRLGMDWMTGLISEYSGKHPDIWTEYTLYDLYAKHTGIREKYHIPQDELPDVRLHCMEQSLWGAGKFENWNPVRAIDGEDPGYFMVLQSITAVALDFDLVRARWLYAARSRFDNYPM